MSVAEKTKPTIIQPNKMGLLVENPVYKPFRYPWCYDAWLTQQRIHWLPEEVPLGDDVRDWQKNLSVEEKNLLIFENNLSFEITDFKEKNFKKIYLVSNKNENRSIKLSEKLVKFKSLLVDDQRQRLKDKSIDCEVIDMSEIKNIENYYSLYPTVGENLDYLNSKNLKMNFLYRNLDQLAWQYCNKGFFNFKSYIPKIISSFN